MKIRQINFLYFLILIVLWPVYDKVFGHVTGWGALIVILLYPSWIVLSPILFYYYNLKKYQKKYHNALSLEIPCTTIWLDHDKKQLAFLCVMNPFRIQYIPVTDIEDYEIVINRRKYEPQFAWNILLVLKKGKKKKTFTIASSGRTSVVCLDEDSVESRLMRETQDFMKKVV